MLKISNRISIPDNELEERFVLASGPGGQNVNKVASAVQLRFDAARSAVLSDEVRTRLLKLAGNRTTQDGEILIEAKRYRSQERNREDARQRLVKLIRKALEPPKLRKKIRPSRAAKRRRLEAKKKRGEKKRLRKTPKISNEQE